MIAYDFKLDENEDLDLSTGDIQIVPSDLQHQKDILQSVPGWWKRFPLIGWDPYKRLNSKANKQEIIQTATIMMQSDGYIKGPLGIDFELTPNGEIIIKTMDLIRP